MKKHLLMLMVLMAFAIPNSALAHDDSDDDHDSGWGNDTAISQDGSSGHVGEEAE